MENGIIEKKVWQTPEIVDLDVDKTTSKPFYIFEDGGSGPAAS